jgi:hypothetical protein
VQVVDEAGMDVARPWPAADVGDAGVVDGDDGDVLAGLARSVADSTRTAIATTSPRNQSDFQKTCLAILSCSTRSVDAAAGRRSSRDSLLI